MEESYETFEEDLWPPKADPRQKPVRTTRRPEMLSTRKVPEAPPPQPPRAEPKTFPREPSLQQAASLQEALSIQNQSPVETPWENVTLNRCLLVAITILVLTSGFQRFNESVHAREDVEDEESGLTERRSGSLRHRGHMMEPQTSLWDLAFMWLPDFDDDDEDDDDDDGENEEEDEDGEVKRGKSKRGEKSRSSLRNKPPPDKKLMKKKDGKLKGKRDEKETRGRASEEGEDEDDQDVPQKTVQPEKKKEKKKTQKE